MPTTPSPAILSAGAAQAHAAASPSLATPAAGKVNARQVAACFGAACARRATCVHYADVESPDEQRFVLTCRTPEGAFPLFEDRRAVTRTSPAADSEGGEI